MTAFEQYVINLSRQKGTDWSTMSYSIRPMSAVGQWNPGGSDGVYWQPGAQFGNVLFAPDPKVWYWGRIYVSVQNVTITGTGLVIVTANKYMSAGPGTTLTLPFPMILLNANTLTTTYGFDGGEIDFSSIQMSQTTTGTISANYYLSFQGWEIRRN